MKNKFLITIIGGTVALALVAGSAAFIAIRSASAQGDLVSRELRSVFQGEDLTDFENFDIAHARPRPQPGNDMSEIGRAHV